MPNDRTIYVFHRAGQAEASQCLLSAHGIGATLWDENVTRSQSNNAISIALQVPEDDAVRALQILREEDPTLFGSADKATQIVADIKRSILRYIVYALGGGFVCFFAVARNGELISRYWAALILGFLCAIPLTVLHSWMNTKRRANQAREATTTAVTSAAGQPPRQP